MIILVGELGVSLLIRTGIILGMGLANERWCYNVTLSLIGWAHTQNDPYMNVVASLGEFYWVITGCNVITLV